MSKREAYRNEEDVLGMVRVPKKMLIMELKPKGLL